MFRVCPNGQDTVLVKTGEFVLLHDTRRNTITTLAAILQGLSVHCRILPTLSNLGQGCCPSFSLVF